MRPIGFRPLLATAAMVTLVATACGTRTSSQELLRAALRETQTDSATQPGGVTPGDAGPALDQTGAAPASDGAVASPDAGGANVGSLPRGGAASAGSAASASPAATPRGANPAGGRSADAAPAQSGGTAVGTSGAGRSTTPSPATPGAPTGPAAGGAKQPVSVGWVGLTSGVIGSIGAGMPAAVRAWAADANTRGGLSGHPIRLVLVDDGGDPNRSVALARRMIEEDKVIAFIGMFAPTTEQALVPLLEEKQVPVISTCGCSPADDTSPMVFPIGPSGDLGTAWAHVVPLLNGNVPAEKLQKVGLLYCRDVPSCPHMRDLVHTFQAAAGFKLVWEAQVSNA